jgi:hypothetical protein
LLRYRGQGFFFALIAAQQSVGALGFQNVDRDIFVLL